VDPVEALEVAIASGEHSRAELAGLIGHDVTPRFPSKKD
jgi:hypothetical protein